MAGTPEKAAENANNAAVVLMMLVIFSLHELLLPQRVSALRECTAAVCRGLFSGQVAPDGRRFDIAGMDITLTGNDKR
jgi:hypothetical protein